MVGSWNVSRGNNSNSYLELRYIYNVRSGSKGLIYCNNSYRLLCMEQSINVKVISFFEFQLQVNYTFCHLSCSIRSSLWNLCNKIKVYVAINIIKHSLCYGGISAHHTFHVLQYIVPCN